VIYRDTVGTQKRRYAWHTSVNIFVAVDCQLMPHFTTQEGSIVKLPYRCGIADWPGVDVLSI